MGRCGGRLHVCMVSKHHTLPKKAPFFIHLSLHLVCLYVCQSASSGECIVYIFEVQPALFEHVKIHLIQAEVICLICF